MTRKRMVKTADPTVSNLRPMLTHRPATDHCPRCLRISKARGRPLRCSVHRIAPVVVEAGEGRLVPVLFPSEKDAGLVPETGPAKDFYGSPPLPLQPTGAKPGSEEKIAVMRERAAQGYALHHPDDAKIVYASQQLLLNWIRDGEI